MALMLRNLALLALVSVGSALDWTATPFNPPAVPLAVRTPYLSCWLPQGAGTALSEAWPTFWTGGVSSAVLSPFLMTNAIFRSWVGLGLFVSMA